jgi:hypothetical protein
MLLLGVGRSSVQQPCTPAGAGVPLLLYCSSGELEMALVMLPEISCTFLFSCRAQEAVTAVRPRLMSRARACSRRAA